MSSAAAQSDKLVARAVRASELVVEVETARFLRPSSQAEVKILSYLKGSPASDKIMVDFERAPVGLWPKLGERRILCLGKGSGGAYRLSAYAGALLPPQKDIKVVVQRSAEPVVAPTGPTTQPGAQDEPQKSVLATRVDMSETVLVGVVSNVRPTSAGALATFDVEEALVGYGKFKEPVTVQFPPTVPAPEPGRYALFLKSRPVDGGFSVVSGSWGIVPVGGEAQQEELKKGFAGIDAKKDALTSIQATILEWQNAWNKRDLARTIKCYASSNRLRGQFEASAEARARLQEQLDTFPGTVQLTVQKIQRARSFVSGARAGAEVSVLLTIAVPGREDDRRTAVMRFVFEVGQWLIHEEGF
jgi:hypothetical protein